MVKATWRILALAALGGGVALPASAQVVIGGSGQPSVEVNWAVLDSLGRQPTLADMLKNDMPVKSPTPSVALPGHQQAVTYHPYRPVPAKKTTTAPKAPKVVPVAAKAAPAPVSPAVADLVRAAQAPKAEPVTAQAPAKAEVAVPPRPPVAEEAPAPAAKPAGPQVSLPDAVSPPPVKAEPVSAPAQVAAVPAPVPAAAAKPEPAPAPAPAPAPQQVALPSGGKGDSLTLVFVGDEAKLPAGAQADLVALARRLEKDESLGLQLLAYAAGDDANASKARRLSLSRALEVRKFLMEQGVRSTRIEVRALGNKLDGGGPADRVDAVIVSR